MTDVTASTRKRKILSLSREKSTDYSSDFPSHFVSRALGAVMVWREGGDMPKRFYKPEEIALACRHAKDLSLKTGERFHVLRSWKAFEPEAE